MKHLSVFFLLCPLAFGQESPRLQTLDIQIGIFERGPLNAITDVTGVRVGHVTLVQGDSVRTGVTAVLPHGGNLFQQKVPAAVFVGNGFGKLVGSTQIDELGQIETPIILTNTLSVWDAAAGVVHYMLSIPGNENIRSINPIVGETNDGFLNDIRGRHVTSEDVITAIRRATTGPVEEGSVGAGTGTVCFGWKGGIGTSSRILPREIGGYVLGVLVQTNYGGILEIAGVPVGAELEQDGIGEGLKRREDGSCMIVVATNAPLTVAQLRRLSRRPVLALGRTGSVMNHGSGDYVIAFSTSAISDTAAAQQAVTDDQLSSLFRASVEATEEAIIHSLLQAKDMKGRNGVVVKALPVGRVKEILRKYGRLGS